MADQDTDPEDARSLRPLLFSIAYGMVGQVDEAEDLVQEALLRLHTVERSGVEVRSRKAFASTVVTRLAIDRSRSARVRRESYVGEWLPEPIVDDPHVDPSTAAELDDSLSIALLTVLERLSPAERAVFLLKDVFEFTYADIADQLHMTEPNVRQVNLRARGHVAQERKRPTTDASHRELLDRFIRAARAGDVDQLACYLGTEVVLHADGGGRAPALRMPLAGAAAVARALTGFARQGDATGASYEIATVNGSAGIVMRDASRRITGVVAVEFDGDVITRLHSMVNPDKLAHLNQP